MDVGHGRTQEQSCPWGSLLLDHLSFLLSPALPWALVSLLLEPGGHILDILTDRWDSPLTLSPSITVPPCPTCDGLSLLTLGSDGSLQPHPHSWASGWARRASQREKDDSTTEGTIRPPSPRLRFGHSSSKNGSIEAFCPKQCCGPHFFQLLDTAPRDFTPSLSAHSFPTPTPFPCLPASK